MFDRPHRQLLGTPCQECLRRMKKEDASKIAPPRPTSTAEKRGPEGRSSLATGRTTSPSSSAHSPNCARCKAHRAIKDRGDALVASGRRASVIPHFPEHAEEIHDAASCRCGLCDAVRAYNSPKESRR